MAELVNHPDHYNQHPSGVECIDIAEHMGFNLGNAFKYWQRKGLKDPLERDQAKTLWYVRREIDRRLGKRAHVADILRWVLEWHPPALSSPAARFLEEESDPIFGLLLESDRTGDTGTLLDALNLIEQAIDHTKQAAHG